MQGVIPVPVLSFSNTTRTTPIIRTTMYTQIWPVPVPVLHFQIIPVLHTIYKPKIQFLPVLRPFYVPVLRYGCVDVNGVLTRSPGYSSVNRT